MKNVAKLVQRRVYTLLGTNSGLCIFSLAFVLILHLFLSSFNCFNVINPFKNKNPVPPKFDNIGNVEILGYEPIDVVYTWVNGSDAIWLAKKNKWLLASRELAFSAFNNSDMTNDNSFIIDSNTTTTTIKSNSSSINVANNDSDSSSHYNNINININININSNNNSNSNNNNNSNSNSNNNSSDNRQFDDSNRYRDSDELRYSIRSLVKNAPWIRRIYIVTDNQIPNWLNLEAGMQSGRLFVISHQGFFHFLLSCPTIFLILFDRRVPFAFLLIATAAATTTILINNNCNL